MKHEINSIVKEIPGWLTEHEGHFLESAALSLQQKRGAIVEIGSYLGKSTIYLSQAHETVYAIDPHKGEFSGGRVKPTLKQFLMNLKLTGVLEVVTPIIKTSSEANSTWKLPIKLLFIDGLHDETHALEDYQLWSSFLVDGGMIAMHDAFCGWDGAGRVAMKHIVYNPDFAQIGVVGSIIYGIQKKSTTTDRIIKVFKQCVIELCQSIYKSDVIPKRIQFILVHKILRIFLLNRFNLPYADYLNRLR